MLTRMHYERIASIIAAGRDAAYNIEDPQQVPDVMAHDFADWLQADNPSFDRERFMAASTTNNGMMSAPGVQRSDEIRALHQAASEKYAADLDSNYLMGVTQALNWVLGGKELELDLP